MRRLVKNMDSLQVSEADTHFTSSPDSTATSTACGQVLNTTELLEEILLHLPLQDIVKDQRVSKTFKAVVKGSSKIQRVVFFTPMNGYGLPYVGLDTYDLKEQHKIIMIVSMIFDTTAGLFRCASKNVLVSSLKNGGAWRQLKISSSKITQVRYIGVVRGDLQTVRNNAGLTMGDIYDAVKKNVPILDKARSLGPEKTQRSARQLPLHITGWEVIALFQELLAGTF